MAPQQLTACIITAGVVSRQTTWHVALPDSIIRGRKCCGPTRCVPAACRRACCCSGKPFCHLPAYTAQQASRGEPFEHSDWEMDKIGPKVCGMPMRANHLSSLTDCVEGSAKFASHQGQPKACQRCEWPSPDTAGPVSCCRIGQAARISVSTSCLQ